MYIFKKFRVYLLLFFLLFSGAFSAKAESEKQYDSTLQNAEEFKVTDEIDLSEVVEESDVKEPENIDFSKIKTSDSSGNTEQKKASEMAEDEETPDQADTDDSDQIQNTEDDQKTNTEVQQSEESVESNDDKEQKDSLEMKENEIFAQSGLLDVGLLNDTDLSVEHVSNGEKEIIKLNYIGYGVLNLDLLSSTYAIFYLPTEIAAVIETENLSAYYDVPRLEVLGIGPRNQGWFDSEEIIIDGNQVYMNFRNLLSVSLLSRSNFNFTLEIELDNIPPSKNPDYVFYSEATNQLLDLSLLEGEDVARDTLEAPQFPEAPVINEPVYTIDTLVTGTGEANADIILTINDEEYPREIDSEGNFSVEIPSQEAGTLIQAVVVNERGHESEEASVTVVEPPDTIPPEAPVVEQIYSNDSVVNGTGEAGTRFVLSIGGEQYEGDIDEEGSFRIDIPKQEPGTMITTVLIDDAGNISEETEVIVIKATLSFYSVPDTLLFEPVIIDSEPITALRQNPDWMIEVSDTRGEGSKWRMTAHAEQPLTSDESHTLPNALVFVDEQDNIHDLTNGPVEVFSGETGGDPITSVQWKANKGPLIQVTPTDAYAQEYRTTITWTLTDAP